MASLKDELAALLIAPPPRRVSRAMLKEARNQEKSFGRLMANLGCFMLGLGLIWVLRPEGWTETLWLRFGGNRIVGSARGEIEGGNWEDIAVGRGTSWVFRYRFRYLPKEPPPNLLTATTAVEAGGSPQAAQTPTLTGHGYVGDPTWQKGEFVRVRYLRRDSRVACPIGARRNAQPAWYLLAVAPVPLFAAGLAALNWIRRRRGAWLIAEGEVVQAEVKEVHTFALQPKGEYRRRGVTHRQTTDEYVINHQVTVTYADDSSRRYLARISSKRDAAFLRTKRTKGQPIQVFRDPGNHRYFLVADTLVR